jgi:hypothetical protein
VLNFKITDIIEASVYNKKKQTPKIERVETVSTVHIAQTPAEEKNNNWIDDKKKNPRNYAKVTKSTRGWTTTIRFGQPKILDEDGTEKVYRYPMTILADIQKRPNLPPPPIEEPEKAVVP